MKKLVILFMVMLVVGCGNRKDASQSNKQQHVFHTYYGDIDIDTMEVAIRCEGYICYKIAIDNIDTIYYDPFKKSYFAVFPTNDEHGNVIAKFDPIDKSKTGNW